MKGFFLNKKEENINSNCDICKLYKTSEIQFNFLGNGKKKILLIGESPGIKGDQVGTSGDYFNKLLLNFNLNRDEDFWRTNAINCSLPNRKPSKKEIKCCKHNIDQAIKKLQPKFIWLMGGSAIESFYMDQFSDHSITTWRKRCIPDQQTNAYIIPLYHPSYIIRNQDEKLNKIFEADLKFAVDCLAKPDPKFEDYKNNITTFGKDQFKTLIHLLDMVNEDNKIIAFDYETSQLNPYKPDPKIWSASFSYNGTSGFAFPIDYPGIWTEGQLKQIKVYWARILENEKVQKVAHNAKFEDKWSRICFNTIPQGWIWDSMVTQHILDDRHGVTGLKFQSYVRWGIKDYEKEMSKYIKSGNGHNDLDKAPLDKLLLYNGLDSVFTYRLYEEQQQEIKRPRFLKRGNQLFLEGTLAFCDVEENGIPVDLEYYHKEDKRLEDEIKYIEQELLNSNEAKRFKRKFGEEIKLGSPDHIKKLLFDVLGLKSIKRTAKDNDSVDKEVLEKIDHPFTKNLLHLRKLEKIKGTYLAQFIREGCSDSKIHPNINLHFASSFRSSASEPNMQNIPIRDEEAKKSTRSGIIPSKGNKILEVDYGSMEVRIIACNSKDKELIKRIDDPHKDWCKKLFFLNDNQFTKDLRFYTKNQFVFPEFYGSWYKACAESLWETTKDLKTKDEITVIEHLRNKGIKRFSDFENHVKDIEKQFWGLFHQTKEWQERVVHNYIKTGYIEMITGFYRQGYLSKNQCLNTPIQGPAFHCLLWSFIQLNNIAKKEEWKSNIIFQIHDSILWDLHPREQRLVIKICKEIMTEKIREEWNWIVVPLIAEFELTEIDQAWYYKKGIE